MGIVSIKAAFEWTFNQRRTGYFLFGALQKKLKQKPKNKILHKAAAVENIKSKLNIHIRREREGNNER